MSIPFTQYLRPNGKMVDVFIDRPRDIELKAQEIIAKGFRFECEELTTGHVSLTISDDEKDHAIKICMNGPLVPETVDKLIKEFVL